MCLLFKASWKRNQYTSMKTVGKEQVLMSLNTVCQGGLESSVEDVQVLLKYMVYSNGLEIWREKFKYGLKGRDLHLEQNMKMDL